MPDAAKAVLHVLPLTVAERPPVLLGVDLRAKDMDLRLKMPSAFTNTLVRRNLDGVVYFDSSDNTCTSYVQVFRTGAIEAVEAHMPKQRYSETHQGKEPFWPDRFETWAITHLNGALAFLKLCDIQPPLLVFLSLLRLKGYVLATSNFLDNPEPFDRDDLLFPEQIIEDFGADAKQVLEDTFRLVWDSANCSRPRQ
jgi:hypothetical protein